MAKQVTEGNNKEPYGSTGVPRRVIGIVYLIVPLALIMLDGLHFYEIKSYEGIIIAVTTGCALLGIGVIKHFSNNPK